MHDKCTALSWRRNMFKTTQWPYGTFLFLFWETLPPSPPRFLACVWPSSRVDHATPPHSVSINIICLKQGTEITPRNLQAILRLRAWGIRNATESVARAQKPLFIKVGRNNLLETQQNFRRPVGHLTLRAKTLITAIRSYGPWHILCDSESFLATKASEAAYKKMDIKLWQVPPRSPDLNPVEKFWAWSRKRLRKLDLDDALAKRPALGKTAYKQRVRSVFRSQKAVKVAKACATGLRKVCQEVISKRCAASRA